MILLPWELVIHMLVVKVVVKVEVVELNLEGISSRNRVVVMVVSSKGKDTAVVVVVVSISNRMYHRSKRRTLHMDSNLSYRLSNSKGMVVVVTSSSSSLSNTSSNNLSMVVVVVVDTNNHHLLLLEECTKPRTGRVQRHPMARPITTMIKRTRLHGTNRQVCLEFILRLLVDH